MSSNRSYPRQPVGFFNDDNGNLSSMRLMSFIALIAAIFFGGLTLSPQVAADDKWQGFSITTCFVLAAFCPKALQKFAERKLSITPTTSYFSNPVVPNFYNGQPRFDYTPTSPYDTVESDN